MIVDVCTYQITTDYVGYPEWISPRKIVIMLDDATYTLSVEIRNGSGGVEDSPVTGPPLFSGINGMSTLITPPPYYQWCDTTTLRKVALINTFPYATIADFPNSSECQIVPVCDLEISSIYSTVKTTDPDTADGQAQITATSSNGTIKYGTSSSFDYATSTNTTGLFTGLLPGTYTLYAKDSVGCMDSIEVTIEVTTEYGVILSGEYQSVNGFPTKIEIVQRGYDGASTEVCFSPNPYTLDYDKCDKFSPFIASHCVVELMEGTEGQFEFLFTDDERKHRIDFYKDFGSGWVLEHTDFVIPEFYSKPFVTEDGNVVTIKGSDQLGNLKTTDFKDGNNLYRGELSQMEIIIEILKKTGFEINLRCADTIFDEAMDTDEDPLTQAFVDVRIFLDSKNNPKNCEDVLKKVINCKSGLRLFQSRGVWWLVRSEDNTGSFDYRVFDMTGAQVDEGTYNPVKQRQAPSAEGIMWRDASQLEAFEANYGFFRLTHILGFDDNLIDEGRFEADDVVELGNGNRTYKNWSVTQLQPGMRYGHEFVSNGESKGAFFADFNNVSANQAENTLYSIEIPISSDTYASANLLKFKFQYNVFPEFAVPWIRIGWKVRIIDSFSDELFLTPSGQWSDVDEPNEIYVSQFGRFDTLDMTAAMPNQANLTGTISIHFYFHNHIGRDYASIAALEAADAFDRQVGKRILVWDSGSGFTYFYELRYGNDAQSSPDIIRPDNFDAFTNALVWELKGKVYIGVNASLVSKILLDNVQLSYIPFDPITSLNFQPPEEADYEQETDAFNKANYEDEFLLGDLPEIENAANLYRGYLRLADGTPTTAWFRNGVTESRKLLTIALNDRIAQLADPVKGIQSSILCKEFYAFIDCLEYDSERFLNGKFVLNDKDTSVDLIILKMTTGADGEPPVVQGAFSNAWSDAFDNGE